MKIITEAHLMEEFLSDESQRRGRAEGIYLPENTADLELLETAGKWTVAGGQTGIYGASVPYGGNLISVKNLNRIKSLVFIENHLEISCQAGLTLEQLECFLKTKDSAVLSDNFADSETFSLLEAGAFFFPVFASEKTATLGGLYHTDAKGIGGSFYGGGKNWITKGKTVDLGSAVALTVELTIKCIKTRAETWGIMFLFSTVGEALSFGEKCCENNSKGSGDLVEVVYFDPSAITLIRQQKSGNLSLESLPELPKNAKAGIYCELHGDNPEDCESFLEQLLELYIESGGDDKDTWALYGEEKTQIHQLLHSIVELESTLVAVVGEDGQRRFSCDYTLPLEKYGEFAEFIRNTGQSAGVDLSVFGYFKRNHLHVALLPKDQAQLAEIPDVFGTIHGLLLEIGGEISEEYGFGRLKPRR